MELKKITEHVYIYGPDSVRDRPMLGYVHGERFSLAVDGGFSPDHVEGFYAALEGQGLPHPQLTLLTHWHWDHTLGLPRVEGLVAASEKTNRLLEAERERLADPVYEGDLRRSYSYVDDEFPGVPIPRIRTAEIEFSQSLVLDLGGTTVRALACENPHTPDGTLIFVPGERVLFAGDATLGSFEEGGRMDRAKLGTLLEQIRELDPAWILLGHQGELRAETFFALYSRYAFR